MGNTGTTSRFRSALVMPIAALSIAGAAACQMSKSSNPLAPTVAGPIKGVVITKPNALEPGQDWQIRMRDQPVKLMIQNADTSGVRTISYTFEVASDAAFNQIVFKKTGVPAGTTFTTVQLPEPLPTGRTYWWRARAEDGANSGDYSKTISFVALAPVVLGTPAGVSPVGSITTTAPEFRVNTGGKSGPYERVVLTLQVANDAGFTSIAATFVNDDNGGQKIINENYTFLNNKTYFWRVQARDLGESQAFSGWSPTLSFSTAVPAPTPVPGPVGNGAWQSCGSTPGEALVTCIRSAVYRQSTEQDAFAVTKRVAWQLRGLGYGLLIKESGENILTWQGKSFSISRVCHPSGYPVKVLSDAGPGGGNGASWGPDPSDNVCAQPGRFWPALNPDLP
jgi:hypothetical protein